MNAPKIDQGAKSETAACKRARGSNGAYQQYFKLKPIFCAMISNIVRYEEMQNLWSRSYHEECRSYMDTPFAACLVLVVAVTVAVKAIRMWRRSTKMYEWNLEKQS